MKNNEVDAIFGTVELQRSDFKNKTVMSKSESLMSLITSCESDPRYGIEKNRREMSHNNTFSHTNSICEGVQVFCRVGHVVRKNTSTYKLSVSVYGSTKSIMLYKGREMCISHRPRYATFKRFIFLSLNRSHYTNLNTVNHVTRKPKRISFREFIKSQSFMKIFILK